MIVSPGLRRFIRTGVNQALASSGLYAPLTHSAILTRGTGSPTFTRETTKTVMGYAPTANSGDSQVLLLIAAGEIGFTGARRISQGVWSNTFADGSPIPASTLKGYSREDTATNESFPSGISVVAATCVTRTLTAAAYTLSFKGTGSVTGTGGWVGTLNGTGATNRVTMTVTATAAAATLTVSGSVTEMQLELGTVATSLIATTTAAVTRNADVLTYQTASNFSSTAGSMYAEVYKDSWASANGVAIGSATNGMKFISTNSGVSAFDGTNTVSGAAGTPTGSVKMAAGWSGSTMSVTANNTTVGTGAYDGAWNLTTIGVGAAGNGNIKNVRIWSSRLSDSTFSVVTL